MARKQRIGPVTKIAMIILAMFADFIDLILFGLSFVWAPIKYFVFWLWFQMLGVSFMQKSGRFAKFGGTFVLELIPFADALPSFTAGVWAIINEVQKEDSQKEASLEKVEEAPKNPAITRQKRG